VSGRDRLTRTERQLLAAVRELIDLPAAARYEDLQGREDELSSRAAWLAGYLSDLDTGRPKVYLIGIGKRAAEPLRYQARDGAAAEQPA
jgi:hypothetical protein